MSNQLTSKTRTPYLSMHLQTTVQGSNNPSLFTAALVSFPILPKSDPVIHAFYWSPAFASINEARDPTTSTFSREYLTRYHSHLQKPQPTNLFGCFWPVSFSLHTVTLRSITHLDYHRNLPPGFLKRIFLWASLVSEMEMWLLFLHCIELSGIHRCSCSVHMLKIRCTCNIRSD